MGSKIPAPLQLKYPDLPSNYYVPKDLWFIRARLLKRGVFAPGPSSSTHSSLTDLEEFRRRISQMGGVPHTDEKSVMATTLSAGHPADKANATGPAPAPANTTPVTSATTTAPPHSTPISYGVWVFIDIQLYQLEANNYMVDFKCDGYQNVIRVEGEGGTAEWRPVSKRFKNKEKEITSPYPFLDVASDLVAQLAVAN